MINVSKIHEILPPDISEYLMWIIIIWSSRQIQVREWHRESCEIVCLNIDEHSVHVITQFVQMYTDFNGTEECHVYINSASS